MKKINFVIIALLVSAVIAGRSHSDLRAGSGVAVRNESTIGVRAKWTAPDENLEYIRSIDKKMGFGAYNPLYTGGSTWKKGGYPTKVEVIIMADGYSNYIKVVTVNDMRKFFIRESNGLWKQVATDRVPKGTGDQMCLIVFEEGGSLYVSNARKSKSVRVQFQ